MHTTQLCLARPCTTNHHASTRRAAVWSALLSVLMLTAAIVTPAVAGPADILAPRIFFAKMDKPRVKVETPSDQCIDLYWAVYDAYKKAGASDSTAAVEAQRARGLCYERAQKK
jgi:hypothetical protein